jgi:uncharacterized membrane protein YbhN (UPF0104 family)
VATTATPQLPLAGAGRRQVVGLAAAAAAMSALCLLVADPDRLAALGAADDSPALLISHVPWLAVAASAAALVLAGFHYLLAAVAIRASSGRSLPLGEATLSQLASSVVNRVVPGGVGGAVVNARYLSRRGLPMGAALATIGVLGVLGALADLLGAGVLVLGGPWLGLGGGTRELHVLAGAGMRWAPTRHVVAIAIGVAVLGGLGLLLYRLTHQRRRGGDGVLAGAHAWRHLVGLARRPGRVSVLLSASAGTTFVLALAFAVVVRIVVGAGAPPLAALAVVYLVGAAAASAIHLPAIAGPTEIALTGALVASGVSAGTALVCVLLFRGLTFWAPVPLGVWALRTLRRRGAL